MLTKIYNSDSTLIFSVIEELNIEEKHDREILNKL